MNSPRTIAFLELDVQIHVSKSFTEARDIVVVSEEHECTLVAILVGSWTPVLRAPMWEDSPQE